MMIVNLLCKKTEGHSFFFYTQDHLTDKAKEESCMLCVYVKLRICLKPMHIVCIC